MEDNKNVIRLYSADVSALADPELFRTAYLAVSDARRAKVDRLRRYSDKRLSLGAELLLRYALRERGIGEKPFVYGENGKPYIAGCPYFSLSHSGDIAVCAVSDFEVGADVEKIRRANMRLARRFFQPEEYAILSRAESGEDDDKDERNELFFRFWTMKESLMKCAGLGLSLSPRDFRAVPGESVTEYGGEKYYFGEIPSIPGYAVSICSAEPFSSVETRNFPNFETVLARIKNL